MPQNLVTPAHSPGSRPQQLISIYHLSPSWGSRKVAAPHTPREGQEAWHLPSAEITFLPGLTTAVNPCQGTGPSGPFHSIDSAWEARPGGPLPSGPPISLRFCHLLGPGEGDGCPIPSRYLASSTGENWGLAQQVLFYVYV